jgi:hypothetical protein
MKRNLSILPLLFVFGCATISNFDQYAYTQTTSVKVDVYNLMSKSNERYSNHLNDLDAVNSKLMKNIEYEKHRSKNKISILMYDRLWKLINDTTTIHGIGKEFKHGFFPHWQEKNTLDTVFISQAKAQIAEGFDLIAELESKKIKESDLKITNFLNTFK